MKWEMLKTAIALTVITSVPAASLTVGDMKEDATHDGAMMEDGKPMEMQP